MTNVFEESKGTESTDNTGESATSNESTTSVTDTLVGEGKKFASIEALAAGKAESDKFIEQLQGELKGLRTDLDKRLSQEEILEEIKTLQ